MLEDRIRKKLNGLEPEKVAQFLTDDTSQSGDWIVAFLRAMLTDDMSPETVSVLVDGLSKAKLLRTQRVALWEKLQEANIPAEVLPELVSGIIKCKLKKEQRMVLLQKLLEKNVPHEAGGALTAALIQAKPEKEDRAALLEYLLQQPLSQEQVLELFKCVVEYQERGTVSVFTKCRLNKEQHMVLLQTLLERSVPHELGGLLTAALIQAKPEKEDRAALLEYLLKQPLNKEQVLELFKCVVEYQQHEAVPDVSKMSSRLYAFKSDMAQLRPWVDTDRPAWKDGQALALYRAVVDGEKNETVLLDLICEGNLCYLSGACIEFLDREQLWVMIQELLFEEEYAFEPETQAPYILDCGVNIGLAIYYFKHRWPQARIVGFEPWSVAYDCAMRNIERNYWTDVILNHAALGPQTDVMQLISMKENSLASTLTNRMDEYIAENHMTTSVENVQVMPLSPYLDGPVDLIKMDIEGMEAQVMQELGERLRLVRWLFCEYHYGPDLKDNSLVTILTLLEEYGFVFEVSKSYLHSIGNRNKPFSHVGKRVSELVYARRMHNEQDK